MDGLMARLQQSQLLRGVVLIVAVLGFLVGVVLVLDFILPNVGRAKDISAIVQSFAASLAIVAAGAYALYKLQIFRTLEPHLTVSHEVSHRLVGDNYVHIDVTAILQNNSKVMVELRKGFFLLQQIGPLPNQEVEDLYAQVFLDEEYEDIQWPTLDEVLCTWHKDVLIVEPGEKHRETREFIVSTNIDTVSIYTYFYNFAASQSTRTAEGWHATTIHDIMERVP